MQSTDEPTEMRLRHDEPDALKGSVRRRPVIHHQQNAGHDLINEQKQRQAAKRMQKTSRLRHRLVGLLVNKLFGGFNRQALAQPVLNFVR